VLLDEELNGQRGVAVDRLLAEALRQLHPLRKGHHLR
jgi:hypothetical protein